MLILYSSTATSFSNLGKGVLKDCISDPLITEELNGAYTLELEYAKDGYLASEIFEGEIIKANNQPFRIWNIKKDMNRIVILAKHIFFDLSTNFLEDVAPTKLPAQNALQWILARTQHANKFVVNGDCYKPFSARYVRKNVTDAIYNENNSILKRFGGELEFDEYSVFIHQKRGSKTNFSIRYRKNLSGIEFNLDFSTIATRIMPQGNNELLLDEKYIDSPKINNYFAPFYKKLEFSDIGVDEDTTEEEAKEQLRQEVSKLYESGIDVPTISIKVDFVELSKCEEYKHYSNLEFCSLGDTIKAIIPELNLDLETRIVKTIYNCNLERYVKLELGSVAPDFVSNQIKTENEISKVNPPSILSQAQQNAESLINHPFKGNLYIDRKTGALYLMDTNDPTSAKNVWKWSLGGLGFSSTGVNGTYIAAITQDGSIVADLITSGKLNTNVIEGYESLVIEVKEASEKVDGQDKKISQITQTVEELNSKIGDIADITISKESDAASLEFEGINQSEPIRIVIRPIGENISYLYPHDNLFPSDVLFLKDRTIRFKNNTTNESIDYELPADLLYFDATNYDEFILDYDGQSCIVNKRVGYNADGTTYILDNPMTVEYDYPRIELTDGYYEISVLGYENAYIFVRLMAQNIYTTQFTTKAEMNSKITQTAKDITLAVDEKLKNYSTTTEMNSAIEVSANKITNAVKETYTTKTELENTTTNFNSKIEQTSKDITNTVSATYETKENAQKQYTQIQQTTNKISLDVSNKVGNNEVISSINNAIVEGQGVIELKSNSVIIDSDNCKLTKEGNIKVTNAEVSGKITSFNGTIGGWNIDDNGINNGTLFINSNGYSTVYTVADYFILQMILLGIIQTPNSSSPQFKHFDFNNDGELNSIDLLYLQHMLKMD